MIKMINKLLCLTLYFMMTSAWSIVLVPNVIINPPSPLSYNGPAGQIPIGAPIGPGWLGEREVRTIFGCGGIDDCISHGRILPVSSPISGVSYSEGGVNYHVYSTGVPGIGYIIGVRDPNSSLYIPGNYPSTQTFPFSSGFPAADDLGYRARIRFVTTGQGLVTGNYTIPAQKIATLSATVSGRNETSNLSISSVNIIVTATGCDITSSGVRNMNLGDVSAKNFANVGSTAGGDTTNISLRCDAGIRLYAVMTDQSNAANRSNILTLAPGSQAKGIGIQFFRGSSSTPISYGPDQSAAGVTNQFYIDTSTSNGAIINVPLTAKYIRTGDIVPGSANGIASITFSYQ